MPVRTIGRAHCESTVGFRADRGQDLSLPTAPAPPVHLLRPNRPWPQKKGTYPSPREPTSYPRYERSLQRERA